MIIQLPGFWPLAERSTPAHLLALMGRLGSLESTVGKHMRANGYIQEATHRDFGTVKVAGQPFFPRPSSSRLHY